MQSELDTELLSEKITTILCLKKSSHL